MWHMKLDMEELEALEIHVTEFWASLTGLHLIRYFKKWAGIEEGGKEASRSMERIDNMAVVDVINGDRAKDIRLSAMLTLREKILKEQKLTSEAAWISTKSTEQLGDDMSRGAFERVKDVLQ